MLQIFAACPLPAAPQCTAFCPMIAKSGATASNAGRGPPAMKVSVPFVAPPIPPETGASMACSPWAVACAATVRALSTSTVEQSRCIAPGFIAGWSSAATARRMLPSGSMVITTSASCAAAAALGARVRPAGCATGSKPVTAWSRARLAAIGPPILPSPIKPIFMLHPPRSMRPCPKGRSSR